VHVVATYGPVLNLPNQFAVTQEIEIDKVACFDKRMNLVTFNFLINRKLTGPIVHSLAADPIGSFLY